MKIKSLLLSTLLFVAYEGGTNGEVETKAAKPSKSVASTSSERLFRYMPENMAGAVYLSLEQAETREQIKKVTEQVVALKSQNPAAGEFVEMLQNLYLGDAGFQKGVLFLDNFATYYKQDKSIPLTLVSQFANAKKAFAQIKEGFPEEVKCEADKEDSTVEVCHHPKKEGAGNSLFIHADDKYLIISLARDALLATKKRDNSNYSLSTESLTNYFKNEASSEDAMVVFASDALRLLGESAQKAAEESGAAPEKIADAKLLQELMGEIKGVSKYSDSFIKSSYNIGVNLDKIPEVPSQDPNYKLFAELVKGFAASDNSSALSWSQVPKQTALNISLSDKLIDSALGMATATGGLPAGLPLSLEQLKSFKGLNVSVANQNGGVPAISIVTKLGTNGPEILPILESLFTSMAGSLGKMSFNDIEVEGTKFRSLTTPFGIGVNLGIYEDALIVSTSANGAGDIIKAYSQDSGASPVINKLAPNGGRDSLLSVYWDPQRTLAAINSVEATASMFTGGQPLMKSSDKEGLKNSYPSLFDIGYSTKSQSFFLEGNSYTQSGYEAISSK